MKLNVSFSDRITDIIEEGIDATVRVGMGNDSRLIMRTLGTANLVTCAAPIYLQQAGTPKTPQELAEYRCINFIYPQTRREFTWKFEQAGEKISLPVPSYLQFDDAEAVLKAAMQGAGIIQAVKYIVADAIARGELQPILTDYTPQLGTPIAVIYPHKRHLSAKIRVFVEFMTELMGDLKYVGVVD